MSFINATNLMVKRWSFPLVQKLLRETTRRFISKFRFSPILTTNEMGEVDVLSKRQQSLIIGL